MELKAPQYIKAVTKDTADIFLFEPIGEGGANGQEFADEIQILNQFGVKEIKLHINTVGGDVIEGQAIFAAILNSDAHVTTIIEGTVASMGAIIALAGDSIQMIEFARLMFHGPRLDKDEDPNEDQQNAIDALKGSMEVILKHKKKTKAQIETLLAGSDTWLTPEQALTEGLIDEIVTIKHLKEIKRQPKSKIAAELHAIISKAEPNKTVTMKNLCTLLGLNDESTEQSIIDAVNKIKGDLSTATSDLETANTTITKRDESIVNLNTTLTGFQDAKIESEETALEETVDAAIDAGKLEKDKKEEYIAKFEGKLDALKLVVGSIEIPTGKAPKVSASLTDTSGTGSVIPEDKKDWNWRKIEAEAPVLAKSIMENNVEKYKEMYKAQYGVDAPEIV